VRAALDVDTSPVRGPSWPPVRMHPRSPGPATAPHRSTWAPARWR